MLTDQQKKAVQMLFEGRRVQETANALRIHRCTLWRWKQRKEFLKEWNRIAREYSRELARQQRSSPAYREREAAQRNARRRAKRRAKRIEARMIIAAERITFGKTKELDRLWAEWKKAMREAGSWW